MPLTEPKLGVYTPIMTSRKIHALQDRCAAVGSTCACFTIRKAARAVTQLFDEVLQPSGLRITQFSLLVALARAESARITSLGDWLALDRTTLTRNLKPLQRQGLIEIATGEDRRARIVRLTERGRQALAKAMPLWERAQSRVVKTLGAGRWDALQQSLSATARIVSRG